MTANGQNQVNFDFNKQNLCREESVTDLQVGSIRCLTPIKPDGTEDESRQTLFVGHTQLRSHQGLVPIHTPLQAATLEAAIDEFPGAMKKAMEEMMERAKQMQAQQQEQQPKADNPRIIVPGK
ncbi:MAG: cytoplasmic protein [Deltaproteobacteria bacterium]|nr:cytoplasmic protein [Deltaproteobacteria bacterium]